MTPILCAQAVADLLKNAFGSYKTAGTDSQINFFTGFLPRVSNSADKTKQNPCVAVRPVTIIDNGVSDESVCELQILVTVYDDSRDKTCLELFHILEKVRQTLLAEEIVDERYAHVGETKTMIPEEQPYPTWWGYVSIQYIVKRPVQNVIQKLFGS